MRIESGSEPIPGYKLLERLGGGGFGEVWKAEAPGGILKAIKFVYGDLQAEDEEGVRRAEQELKSLKRVKSVRHPYLLSLERYDIIENRLVIVMELADRNLWDRFKECRAQGLPGIPREELLRYMEETAEVLDLMNGEYQLQHLDIKPQNLFLIYNHIKVADFGLVKDLSGMQATITGGVTPVYAAPETFDGVVSRYCDQYSLAMVYQELLTGQRPFSGTSVQQLIMQHLSGAPNLTPLPASDRAAIARALAKKPEDRHPSCGDLVRALRAGNAGPGTKAVVSAAGPSGNETAAPVDKLAAARPVPVPTVRPTSAPGPRPAVSPAAKPPTAPKPAAAPVGRPPGAERPVPARRPVAPPLPAKPAGADLDPATDERPPARQAPPEKNGPGVLLPALLIGVGQLGLLVLRSFRAAILERFGTLQATPQLRTLFIDTDPETTEAAVHDGDGTAWEPKDVILARLNRPSHYLRPRDGRVCLDLWFNSKMLYHIPRNPATAGLRPLGRLALFDNFRLIAGRLQEELEACVDPDHMAAAERQTRLGLRTNRPRVYVVCGLAGGTGGGMFLDLGYLLRAYLQRLGYSRPEVVGVFLLPPAGPQKTLPLANAHAALRELNHFSAPNVVYSTRFDERDPVITDPEPPFSRLVFLQLPDQQDALPASQVIGMAGEMLYRELLTPLGRKADISRRTPPARGGVVGQSFGLYRLSWPRRVLLQKTARRLCLDLARRWLAAETPEVRSAVDQWVAEQWSQQELEPEYLIGHLRKACTQALGKVPEDAFADILGPYQPRSRRLPELSAAAVLEILGRFDQLLGRPTEPAPAKACTIQEALDKDTHYLVQLCTGRLTEIALAPIDRPEFRVAGAEKAVAALGERIDRALEHHEPLCKELADRSTEAFQRIHALLVQLQAHPGGGRRVAPIVAELVEVLRQYPKWRYQHLVLRCVLTILSQLRTQLVDQERQVEFCRQRLGELLASLEAGDRPAAAERGPGRFLLPHGATTLAEAVQQLRASVTPEQFAEFDRAIQAMVEQQFTNLVQVCMTKSNLLQNLETAMLQSAEGFVASRLAGGNVLEMFFDQHPAAEDAAQAVAEAYERAAPELAHASRCREPELTILALPGGPLAERFADLVRRSVPDTSFTLAESTDDAIIYREQSHLPLGNLELAGPLGEEAYLHFIGTENITPHSRCDITDWRPLEPD
ncbi:MAG: protein kinase [Gemmataceae bacterium]|nr:protein kinase [Gemmataceae bacterium]MDW8267293.1 tubulin-like doman-containing protein [Gemmataceae bacterium]